MSVKLTRPHDVFDDKPLAMGKLTEKVSDTEYKVRFHKPSPTSNAGELEPGSDSPPLVLDIGTRAKLFYGAKGDHTMVMGGIIVKVNGNATYTMLMENDEIELSVSPESIYEKEEPTKLLHNAKFLEMVDWLRSSIHDSRDCEAAAAILFHRGWRVERMYLLEMSDLTPMVFISKLEREGVMEKAQWERDHHNVIRLLHRERVKDRDIRYALSKYKGTMSCITGIIVVSYVFTSNLRAYRRQQRGHQLKIAVRALSQAHQVNTTSDTHNSIVREEEEEQVRQVLRQLDTAHPRIVVFTGHSGCGKSSLCRSALQKEKLPAVFVDVRESEDTLRSVVKALGVQNIEVCGDLLDFVAEGLRMASRKDRMPVLVIKLREGSSLEKVYREAVGLVSDHQACHIIFEVPLGSLTPANMGLPRLDFYTIPNFNRKQAFQYTQHALEPLDLLYFIETIGTNSNDLDELFAAVRQRGVDPVAYMSLKLMKAMRRIQAAASSSPSVKSALIQLAEQSFDIGLPEENAELFAVMNTPALKDIVFYDPVNDRWLFTQQVLHTATRCFM